MSDEETLLLGIRAGTLAASTLTVALVALAHIGLKVWAHRRHLREQARAAATAGSTSAREWLASILRGLVAPVALMLWIQGLHYALSTLLAEVPYPLVVRYAGPVLDVLQGVATVLALVWLFGRLGRGIEVWLRIFALRSEGRTDDLFLPIMGTAIRVLLPLLAIIMGSPMLSLPERLHALLRNAVAMALIGAFAFVLFRLVDAFCQLVISRNRIDVPDNREARAVLTQVTLLRKVALWVIAVFALASMLMVFDSVRQLGTAILASAGVAGLALGFAAQRSIATLLAGFQVALTQPIRIGDVVIVEGEWGRIEEITLTYVVISIWDLRRLIVPMTYFLEKPFQNWTRNSADLLAYVYVYADYSVPMDQVRGELTRILEASPLWDRKINELQVTEATERTVQIRALASASDSTRAWDLRCEVREKLIAFLQREHPEGLPRLRLAREEARP